jgi:ABC-type multidrug transport system ATPase subunit
LAGLAGFEGSVRIGGRAIDRDPASREKVGYLAQIVSMPDQSTVGEVIDFFAELRGADRDTIPLPEGFVRDDDDRIGILSGGQRHRVALAVALLGEPTLLLLDEPVASLDEEGRQTFWKILRTLRDERGVTSIVSSPSPSELRGVADLAMYMDDGRLVLQEDLRHDPDAAPDDPGSFAKESWA